MQKDFIIQKAPLHRRMVEDAIFLQKQQGFVHALVEIDITEIRQKIKMQRRLQGGALSLSAYLMHCFSQALAKHPEIQAFPIGNKRIIPKQVALFVPTVSTYQGQPALRAKIIKNAADKSPFELELEYQQFQQSPPEPHPYEIAFLRLPQWLRRLAYYFIMRIPSFRLKHTGTAYFTSVNKYVKGEVQVVPAPFQSIGMLVTSVTSRMVWQDDSVHKRDILLCTLSANHVVTDGAQLAIFINSLKSEISNGLK